MVSRHSENVRSVSNNFFCGENEGKCATLSVLGDRADSQACSPWDKPPRSDGPPHPGSRYGGRLGLAKPGEQCGAHGMTWARRCTEYLSCELSRRPHRRPVATLAAAWHDDSYNRKRLSRAHCLAGEASLRQATRWSAAVRRRVPAAGASPDLRTPPKFPGVPSPALRAGGDRR